jgi:hypothetical protein
MSRIRIVSDESGKYILIPPEHRHSIPYIQSGLRDLRIEILEQGMCRHGTWMIKIDMANRIYLRTT